MGGVRSHSSKIRQIKWHLCHKDKGYKIFKGGVKPNWPQLNSLCSYTGLIPVQKIQFGFSSKH